MPETDATTEKLLKAAMQQLHLSARAYHLVLKLAHRITDLVGSDVISAITRKRRFSIDSEW